METSSSDPRTRRHELTDWLSLHEIDAETCSRILDAIERRCKGEAPLRGCEPIDGDIDLEAAWRAVVQAMQAFLPASDALIDDIFENSAKIVVSRAGKSRKALTLDRGPTSYPAIYYSYRGTADDLLIIAHEFGHAVQIRASGGKTVPPVMREICAFLGEHALLKFASESNRKLHDGLARSWRSDSRSYFSKGATLRAALSQPHTAYDYSWNYPIARYFAARIFEQWPAERIWTIFAGEKRMTDVLEAWPDLQSASMRN